MAKITLRYCEGRKSPFQIAWSENGKRISRFFQTEDEREDFLNKKQFLSEEKFGAIMAMDEETISDVAKIEMEREDVSFRDIWEFWKKNHKGIKIISLWMACNNYLKDLKTNNKISSAHYYHVRKILETLCDSFDERNVSDITRSELENWLKNLNYCPVTKKNYRSTVRAAWGYFERQDYIQKNIAVSLECPKIEQEEIKFLSVSEVEHLLRVNEKVDPEICGLMALGLFAGMRSSAIPRVEYNEIDFKTRGILTPASKTKKGRRNFIENLPDNLWAWLENTPQTAFGWNERKWKKRREIALRRAGLLVNGHNLRDWKLTDKPFERKIPPKNAFRHSFASYHVAWKRDFQDTALIMSHKGTDILFKHYRGNATKEDADKYFNIYPESYGKKEEI